MEKSRYKPTDPDLFKVTLFPVANCDDESLRKSFVESTFIRVIMEGLKEETNKRKKNESK